MNKAFHDWMKAAENHTWGNDDLWQAACDWQKERDAQICEHEAQEIAFSEGNYFARVIRNQDL